MHNKLISIIKLLVAILLIHAGTIAIYSAFCSRKIVGELLVAGLAIFFLRSFHNKTTNH